MIAKLTRGNQVTIPKLIVEKAHLRAGSDYMEVEYRDGIIHLKPVDVEERIPPEVFEKFQKRTLKPETGDVALSGKEAEGLLSGMAKKSKK